MDGSDHAAVRFCRMIKALRRHEWMWLAILGLLVASTPTPAEAEKPTREPVRVIFDTDMYSDIDDMLALAMLHALQDRGEIDVRAVTIGTEAPWTAPYVDLVNSFYGHGNIPVGLVRGGITAQRFDEPPFSGTPQPYSPNGINYTQYVSQLKRKDGSPLYPHRLHDGSKAEEAVRLLRRILAAQPDGSVVMIQVGYSTNFARLLDSKPDTSSTLDGRALVKRKVRLLSAMAGNFGEVEINGIKRPAGIREFNLMMAVRDAQKVFSQWPTPIVASGFEVGFQMLFPQRAFDCCFNSVDHHPIAETFQYVAPYYRQASADPKAPHDHATFDLTSVLYAARPDDAYFSLSKPGTITVLDNGGSTFQESEGGLHRFLVIGDNQKARTLETMVMLASQPPVHSPGARK